MGRTFMAPCSPPPDRRHLTSAIGPGHEQQHPMSDDSRPHPEKTPAAQPGLVARLIAALRLKGGTTLRSDLEVALAQNGRDAELSPQERVMLANVLSLRTKRVADVMVPRADIVACPADISLGELLAQFRTAGHSRLPVYGETLDDPRGMVHIRDFLDFMAARAEASRKRRRKADGQAAGPDLGAVDLSASLSSARILRPVLYVPASMPAVDLLVRMQSTRTHMALVIDEYGGTDGLVSIEDLVEIVVGDIEDEHDEADGPSITRMSDGRLVADARAAMDEAFQALGLELSAVPDAEEVDTLGGYIVGLAGRVPARGELISHESGLEFRVLEADARRIRRLRVRRPGVLGEAPRQAAE
jgi:CBS domain containing-hemolysin-like protein